MFLLFLFCFAFCAFNMLVDLGPCPWAANPPSKHMSVSMSVLYHKRNPEFASSGMLNSRPESVLGKPTPGSPLTGFQRSATHSGTHTGTHSNGSAKLQCKSELIMEILRQFLDTLWKSKKQKKMANFNSLVAKWSDSVKQIAVDWFGYGQLELWQISVLLFDLYNSQ